MQECNQLFLIECEAWHGKGADKDMQYNCKVLESQKIVLLWLHPTKAYLLRDTAEVHREKTESL